MRRILWTIAIASAISLTAQLSPGTAAAQEGAGVINLDETVIKGRIQKPEAFYILQHANLNYEGLEPKPTFIPELLESVETEPF